MNGKAHVPMEEQDVFRRCVAISDDVWRCVEKWPGFARDTNGRQLVRSVDSVGANLVEGDGRGSDPDAIRFFVIGQASAREARYWLERAVARGIPHEPAGSQFVSALTDATKMLNRLIQYRRARPTSVRDIAHGYEADCDRSDGRASASEFGARVGRAP